MNPTAISLLCDGASPVLYRTEKEEKLPRAERPDRGLEGLQSAKHGIAYNANRREADEKREKQSAGIRRSSSLGRDMNFCGVLSGRRGQVTESGSWILLIGQC
ncbi:hypothetical protein AMEX_G4316 [Astyanax mexicanus]|uniref:Uncharacterized protein n=1 Tax=Astyanax mexicanus TaxID=7994 RepID=A0A8T2MJ11_ASTMX|nr:hypothetical protein AMEX_G4316 [Astyanax mexicanus]